MIEGWSVVALALGYVSILFALAWYADRAGRFSKGGNGRPLIYALSLAVYCTSWTFFGSVGNAATTGYDFIPVYLGPILLFVFGWRFLLRVVRLAKSQNITSVADFLAARYGKSQAVAAIVTVIAVAGTLPYIALQLKAVALSVDTLLGARSLQHLNLPTDTAFIIALTMATFAVLFGTRHIDATEHQEGLIVAVAAESLVKLAAFLAVGFFVTFSMLGGIGALVERVQQDPEIYKIFAGGFHGVTWLTVTFLSLVAILLLPRQFHVTVVENNSEKEIRRAAWLFPVYLVLINLFVVPIAAAGLLSLPKGSFDADSFVLALPLSAGADTITLLAFVGGLSAATAMVIVDSVALAIMVSNGLVLPLLLRRRGDEPKGQQQDMTGLLLAIRRVAIFAVILLGYLFYRLLGQTHGLASIGLVSFAAVAQFAPAFFGGLVWRNATARGAIGGIVSGFAVWAYTLLLPWIIEAGWAPRSILIDGPFGLDFLSPGPCCTSSSTLSATASCGAWPSTWPCSSPCRCLGLPSRSSVCRHRCSCRRPSPDRRCRPRFGGGARPSPQATCSTRLPGISVPSAPNARSPSMRPAATRRPRPMRKPTSTCCASPSICWPAPSAPRPRDWSCPCCCAAAMPAANRRCACSTMPPKRCSTTATCCNRRSIRCVTA